MQGNETFKLAVRELSYRGRNPSPIIFKTGYRLACFHIKRIYVITTATEEKIRDGYVPSGGNA